MVLQASIGVHPPEHEATQRVRINIDLGVEDDGARPLSRTAVGRDELTRVVDYEQIANAVRRIVAAGHVRLVETLGRTDRGSLPRRPSRPSGADQGREVGCFP